jgi:ribosomal protein L11 methyltransferase
MNYLEFNFIVLPKEPFTDILIAELADLPFESFDETPQGVKAYIQQDLFNESEFNKIELLQSSEVKIKFEKIAIEQQNWNQVWESNFDPIFIEDKVAVVAPFHEQKTNCKYTIVIEPKMSFGTGHHETTFLMLNELYSTDVKNKKVLDMGCGTSVLAILASKLGAAQITAIDIEEWACENSKENAQRNNCSNISVLLGNINRNILQRDMQKYVEVLEKNGEILFSGFFAGDVSFIEECAVKNGLKIVAVKEKNNWALVKCIKN